MSAVDVLLPARAVFHPVVDLDTGSVVAVETHAGPSGAPPAGTRVDPAAEDLRRAVEAARAAAGLGTPLPLQIGLRADSLTHGDAFLAELHHGLGETGRRPQEVIICVTGGFHPSQRPAVSGALRGLRRAGYLVGLAGVGAAYAPLDLLVDGAPYLAKLDPELARRTGGDPRRSALVTALVDLAHRLGAHVLAPGLATEDQVLNVRELGVRLVQGPALAPPEWRPGMPITVPVAAEESGRPDRAVPDLGPRVSEFTLPAVTMPHTATADAVLNALNAETGTTSVVLVDERQRPRATVDRTRFLLRLSGAYGHALHAHKPAARLADPPRLVPRTVPAVAALRAAGREGDRVYDDLVVVDEHGRCLGIVRVSDLIRGLSP
ncbi:MULTISPECIES: EAL domain-containing protein [Actinomadura]|uniref:EAL domain-containing protein n=1 Tax=Actinomadura yumaensis TaxID=111807 RepID=A0ABW2D0G4_9ACTN|nr:EAL domain-containing protein [Actinomadura sp. J1-007]